MSQRHRVERHSSVRLASLGSLRSPDQRMRRIEMAVALRPDQTFYPSPRLAAEAPVETIAYMVTFDPMRSKQAGLVALNVDRASKTFGQEVGRSDGPHLGDEIA